MHKIDGPGNDDGQFTEGNPSLGIPPTTVTSDILNALQDEIANVIEDAGLALSKPDNTQLLAAIERLIDRKPIWTLPQAFGAGLATGATTRPAAARLNGTDVAFCQDTNDELRTYRFNTTTWTLVGTRPSNRLSDKPSAGRVEWN
jgi:hypothetical protein